MNIYVIYKVGPLADLFTIRTTAALYVMDEPPGWAAASAAGSAAAMAARARTAKAIFMAAVIVSTGQ
jgi:hypothetical protein